MPPEPPSGDRTDREVLDRLDAIRREKKERMRWRMSHHTAERAMEAIRPDPEPAPIASSKSRRRKRHKRML